MTTSTRHLEFAPRKHPMSTSFCDGLVRRDFLRLGVAGMFGSSLSLASLIRAEAAAGARGVKDTGVSVVYLLLKGGLSPMDTFDLKPSAPAEFRGEFHPIGTNVPGLEVGNSLPKRSQQMDKVCLLRGFGHKNSDHGPADHYMLTGYFPTAGFNPSLTPNNQRPSFGSIIAKKLGGQAKDRAASSIPPYVCLPQLSNSGGAAYLGATCAPLSIDADPAAPDFAVPDMVPPVSLSAGRLSNRRELLRHVDQLQKSAELDANTRAKTV